MVSKETLRRMIESRVARIESPEDYYHFLGYIDMAESTDIITTDEYLKLLDTAIAIKGVL